MFTGQMWRFKRREMSSSGGGTASSDMSVTTVNRGDQTLLNFWDSRELKMTLEGRVADLYRCMDETKTHSNLTTLTTMLVLFVWPQSKMLFNFVKGSHQWFCIAFKPNNYHPLAPFVFPKNMQPYFSFCSYFQIFPKEMFKWYRHL